MKNNLIIWFALIFITVSISGTAQPANIPYAKSTFITDCIIDRYFLLTANGDGLMTNYKSTHNLGIYESEHPWGPWKTVYWNDSFHKDWSVFGPQMVSKWISADGKTFYLLYSNFPNGPYKFNLQKVTFKVAGI